MFRKTVVLFVVVFLLVLVGCRDDGPSTSSGSGVSEPSVSSESDVQPEAEPVEAGESPDSSTSSEGVGDDDDPFEGSGGAFLGAAQGVVISEVLVGVPGNNNQEFIELYNASESAVDLDGYTLFYKVDNGQDEQQVMAWAGRTEVPPWGHLLLVQEGQDFGLVADGLYSTPLSQRQGGLVLRDSEGEAAAQFGWGDAPDGFVTGAAMSVPGDGASMERLPGGEAGNGVDTWDNAADFIANSSPNPQNSGSPATPLVEDHFALSLEAPDVVEPGVEFDLVVTVQNQGSAAAQDITVVLPMKAEFALINGPEGAEEADGLLRWTIPALGAGENVAGHVTLQSPYTYIDTLFSGAYAEAQDWSRDYAAPQLTSMAGGAVPIATARELIDSNVSVEGVATMYTGGFFAGSGTKFYLQDESGGIQVYVPNAGGVLEVNIGDRVRVTGDIELYRDSIELIPEDFDVQVEILESNAAEIGATEITPLDNENNPEVIGRLNTIEGTATRIEEFTYSYEVDLMDEAGNETLVYIDKDSGVTAEPLEMGEQYRITGISEFYSSEKQLMPRLQEDIVKIYPPVLLLEVGAANNAKPGEILTYVISVTNHTAEPMTNVQIAAPLPDSGAAVSQISSGGLKEDDQILWTIDSLEGSGGLNVVSFNALVDEENTQPVAFGAVTAMADQWTEPVVSEPFLTFIGSGVPIWAIQGSGARSPYVLSEATTNGIVTGAFPEMQGFWIQEVVTDDDPATSAGLFVLFGNQELNELPVMEGDLVQVNGRVREISGQTTLHVKDEESIMILGSEQVLPDPVAIDPPRENEAADTYKEALEGMLVTLPGSAVAVAPTTQYGEYVVVNDHWGVDSVRRGEESGFTIMVDDGSQVRHEDQSTLPYAIQKGDLIQDLTGPLAYTFDQYKIEPLNLPLVQRTERETVTLAPAAENQFSVATFNVENLFDTKDPHPDSPPRPNRATYENKLNKIAAAIEALGAPAIIGMQEVENIDVLEDLSATELLAPYNYTGYLVEGPDGRGIDVAYLVRSDQVTVESVEAFPEPTGLTTRPPLLIKAVVQLESGPETVYLLNNHLSSLSSGEAATEPRRTGQAAWNLTIMEQVLAEDPGAQFIVLGDMNSFLNTPPLDVLQEAGLRHAYEFFENEEDIPYTYIFQGATQTLDHILMSEELFEQVSDVTTLPIDADYPLAAADDASPRRVSDHDPLLVMFTINGN